MGTILYLDAEDEITTAATRIRGAAGSRVGIVLPFGSRVATSRINFRLLAREAAAAGCQLDVVAPDASTRALAASAGLSVFGSVTEYEAALASPVAVDQAAGRLDAAGVGTVAGITAAGVAGGTIVPIVHDAPSSLPVVRPRRRLWRRGVLAVLVFVLFAGGAAAVAGALVLPSATITVTPRHEPVGPLAFTVAADPEATEVDPDAGVIPAQLLEIAVQAEGEFPATGKRVERTKATGGVRWTNCDPTAAYQIPAGTVVRTSGGIGFETEEAVFLPVAIITGSLDLRCQTSEVSVTALEAGTAGNVAAGTIRVVPSRYNRNVIRVTNPRATSGGSRKVFPKVSQEDVDVAVEQLTRELEAQFATELENPELVPSGSVVYPGTAELGEPVLTLDPQTLVDQEVESFALGMSATGTVQAVDPALVDDVAAARLADAVEPGHDMVEGSARVRTGDGVVVAGTVTFPVAATALQISIPDAATLEARVLGLSKTEATAALEPYGEVSVVLWPDWVQAVPTLDQRVTLEVAPPAAATPPDAPEPEPIPVPVQEPSAEPGASPAGEEPVPSAG
jgi:hypothetical protein